MLESILYSVNFANAITLQIPFGPGSTTLIPTRVSLSISLLFISQHSFCVGIYYSGKSMRAVLPGIVSFSQTFMLLALTEKHDPPLTVSEWLSYDGQKLQGSVQPSGVESKSLPSFSIFSHFLEPLLNSLNVQPSRKKQPLILRHVGGILMPCRMILFLVPPCFCRTVLSFILVGRFDHAPRLNGNVTYNKPHMLESVAQGSSASVSLHNLQKSEIVVRRNLEFSVSYRGVRCCYEVLVTRRLQLTTIELVFDVAMVALVYVFPMLEHRDCCTCMWEVELIMGFSSGQIQHISVGQLVFGSALALFTNPISNSLKDSIQIIKISDSPYAYYALPWHSDFIMCFNCFKVFKRKESRTLSQFLLFSKGSLVHLFFYFLMHGLLGFTLFDMLVLESLTHCSLTCYFVLIDMISRPICAQRSLGMPKKLFENELVGLLHFEWASSGNMDTSSSSCAMHKGCLLRLLEDHLLSKLDIETERVLPSWIVEHSTNSSSVLFVASSFAKLGFIFAMDSFIVGRMNSMAISQQNTAGIHKLLFSDHNGLLKVVWLIDLPIDDIMMLDPYLAHNIFITRHPWLLYMNLEDKVLFEVRGIVMNTKEQEDSFGILENYLWDPG